MDCDRNGVQKDVPSIWCSNDRAIQPNGKPRFQAFDDQRFPTELPRSEFHSRHDDDREEGGKRQSMGHNVHGRSELKIDERTYRLFIEPHQA